MTTSETTRLRALLTTLGLPLRFDEPDTIVGASGASGPLGFFVSTHAPGFVAAVNALPALLDRAEAAEARVAALEAQGLALAEDARAAYAQRREMGREAQRLREIVAGRTTPPTDAEFRAHDALAKARDDAREERDAMRRERDEARAEVRRLTAALDAARREGAEAMRVALVAMVGRRAAAWVDDADEHGDEDAATRWEEATEIRNAIRALPLPGDALPEHATTPAPVCPAPTEGT